MLGHQEDGSALAGAEDVVPIQRHACGFVHRGRGVDEFREYSAAGDEVEIDFAIGFGAVPVVAVLEVARVAAERVDEAVAVQALGPNTNRWGVDGETLACRRLALAGDATASPPAKTSVFADGALSEWRYL